MNKNNNTIKDIKNRIATLEKEGEIWRLHNYMKDNHIESEQYKNITKSLPTNVWMHLVNFFEMAIDKENRNDNIKEESKEDNKKDTAKAKKDIVEEDVDLNKIRQIKRVMNKTTTTKKIGSKVYKNDLLIDNMESKETIFRDVKEIIPNERYGMYLNGEEIVELFLHGNLVYDATMQRGVKVAKDGSVHANFKEAHIKDLYNALLENQYAFTQMTFGCPTDVGSNTIEYDAIEKELVVNGKNRIIDGQHRIRTLVKLYMAMQKSRELSSVINLKEFIFNVEFHFTTSEKLREIFANINKQLKLDKSQVRQLGSDHYAKIVNYLNQNSESDLKGKIATAKPVGNRLVLFNTMTESIEKSIIINSVIEREEIIKYLKNFFNYLAYKLPEGFGNDLEKRKEFKEKSLLNENNFFRAWIAIAFQDVVHYKENIEAIVANKEYFNKDNEVWLNINAVRAKKNNKGFAMNNTNVSLAEMVKRTLEKIPFKQQK